LLQTVCHPLEKGLPLSPLPLEILGSDPLPSEFLTTLHRGGMDILQTMYIVSVNLKPPHPPPYSHWGGGYSQKNWMRGTSENPYPV